MFSLPTSRHWLPPAVVLLVFVLFYRSMFPVPASVKTIVRLGSRHEIQYGIKIPQEIIDENFMPLRDPSKGHLWPEQKYYYKYSSSSPKHSNAYLEPLLRCRQKPNPYTNHIRLPNIVQNVSQLPSANEADDAQKFNPTIIALPPWSPHQYLLVSRVVTEGLHQESLLCEADTCSYSFSHEPRRPGEKDCTADDLTILGATGGLRCATPPKVISIPPTPAEKCEGSWSSFPDIPGFHDPRIFWSGKGEPLIMVNSASRYACVGLWIADLRTLHEPLKELLMSQPGQPYLPGPLMSYPTLTELTRNPASTRASVEKNWFMFFPTAGEAFLHYDLSIPRVVVDEGVNKTVGGRTFAKVIGNGFTTPNITDPSEAPCLPDEPDSRGKYGHWHQTSNALKLILCRRAEAEKGECNEEQEGRAVHFAVMHRKFSNEWKLPLRYERFFAVWDARPPFHLLGMSRYPVLMWNETASGWSAEENWAADDDNGSNSDDSSSEVEGENEEDGGDDDDDDEVVMTATTSSSSTKQESNHHDDHPSTTTNLTSRRRNTNTTTHPNPPPQPPLPPPPPQHHNNKNWAYFTYTPSIAWAFRPFPPGSHPLHERENHQSPSSSSSSSSSDPTTDSQQQHTRILEALNTGFLDDEVILGIGIDDRGQGFARVKAEELLGCLRACRR